MKKQNNIETLKAAINATILEEIELKKYGVQAYRINYEEEYCVITKAAKINGRYYFIDREGRRYLISRYEESRAEIVAGDFMETHARDLKKAQERAATLQKEGRVYVESEIVPEFYDACDAIDVRPDLYTLAWDDSQPTGRQYYSVYVIKKEDTPTAPETTKEVTAAPEMEPETEKEQEDPRQTLADTYQKASAEIEVLKRFAEYEGRTPNINKYVLMNAEFYGLSLTALYDYYTGVIETAQEAAAAHHTRHHF